MHLYWKRTWHSSQLDSILVLNWVGFSPNMLLIIAFQQCLVTQCQIAVIQASWFELGVCTANKRTTGTVYGTVQSPSFFTIIFVLINHCTVSKNETLQRSFVLFQTWDGNTVNWDRSLAALWISYYVIRLLVLYVFLHRWYIMWVDI